ncbi:hypothetical protein Q8A73_004242 [Channa argus]|nr:hypothetical protein Q8A73_004242 [Channa argus]
MCQCRRDSILVSSLKKVQKEIRNKKDVEQKTVQMDIARQRWGCVCVGGWGWDDGTLSTELDGTDKSMRRNPLIDQARHLLHPPLVALKYGDDCVDRLSVPVNSVLHFFITTMIV